MYRPRHAQPERRRGIILLVVVALLTLFAIVGLTFVLYAEAEANSSRTAREAEAQRRADMDPEAALAFFLNQLIYDTRDDTGTYSSLRGQGLARLMYGYNPGQPNNVPFNGVGRIYAGTPWSAMMPPPMINGEPINDRHLVNYMVFRDSAGALLDGALHDPERPGWRNDSQAQQTWVGGFNVPYTYPDHNNMFLAAVRADGSLVTPSYHRAWLFGSLAENNPNWWGNTYGKYLTLRPRPVDHLTQAQVAAHDAAVAGAQQLGWPLNLPVIAADPVKGPELRNLILGLQQQGKLFPYPDDANGDVANLRGNGRGDDSIWIDIGAPILTAPDGRKYKMLVAPLILDLDGKVNINVHGNIRGTDAGGKTMHVSNQGWGPWEIDLSKVLNGVDVNGNPEYANLFIGTGGRYGPDQKPASTDLDAPGGAAPPPYSKVDFDGSLWNGTIYTTTNGPIQLPTTGPGNVYTVLPTYPQGYDNGSNTNPGDERYRHPKFYNYFDPTIGGAADDRRFRLANLEALYRYGDTGSHALGSELFRLCPISFNNPRTRRQVTLLSMDLDRPGMSPWVWDPTANPFRLTAPDKYPKGGPIIFPLAAGLGAAPPAGSDFAPDWRATALSTLTRLDLNTTLTDYPPPDPPTGATPYRISNVAQFTQAQTDRQNLAREVFNRLRTAVGTRDPSLVDPTMAPQEYDALRWLAQLAVNIVDYIDSDDYMTPFNWDTTAGMGRTPWVYGTELPRLLINEVYSEMRNDPGDAGKATATLPYKRTFWVELHNPMPADPILSEGGAARLQVPGGAMAMPPAYAAYQLVIAQTTNPPNPFDVNAMRTAANVDGQYPDPTLVKLRVADFTPDPGFPPPMGLDVNVVNPAAPQGAYIGPNGDNKGFYVLGPKYDFPNLPNATPAVPQATLRVMEQDITLAGEMNPVRSAMSYDVPIAGAFDNPPPNHTVLLRRLACPHLPYQPNPGPGFNPYVTVDYAENLPLNDAVEVIDTGAHTARPIAERFSFAKRQPYASDPTVITSYKPDADPMLDRSPLPPNALQPQHTFFRHNAREAAVPPPADPNTPNQTMKIPFDWLVHLDRQLVSPMELLHVSGFKPHELTQEFAPKDVAHQHYAPWFRDPDARLFRAFEFFKVKERAAGVPNNGRIPGKININTVFDEETFQALCSALNAGVTPNPNKFDSTVVQTIYNKLIGLRQPGDPAAVPPIPAGQLSGKDRPFQGMAAPYTPGTAGGDQQYPNGLGVNDTFLLSEVPGGAGNTNRLLQVPTVQHPYQQTELLNKVYNNLTSRSNVFAVWVTVGFFEVTDDTTRPVKLGAEIGRSEGRHVRHRMFAIVDRSALTDFNGGPQATFDPRIAVSGTGGRLVPYFSIID